MASMIKEERYVIEVGNQTHILLLQELLWGSEWWPERFRVQLPAANGRSAENIFGSSARETLEMAAECLLNSRPLARRASEHSTAAECN
jgi:hypothetical protein